MSLSALIKKGGLRGLATATPATSATDGAPARSSVATVATVAVATAQNKPANDPAQPHHLDPEAFAERAAIMEHDGGLNRAEAEAAAAAICGEPLAPDRHCWPHTTAMNTVEIDTFMARVHLFTARGLDYAKAEGLADGLVRCDRAEGDRRLCLECTHIRRPAGIWSCGKWQRAGLDDAGLPGDLTKLPQRCDAFKGAMR